MSNSYNPEYHRQWYKKNKSRLLAKAKIRYESSAKARKDMKDRAWKSSIKKKFGISVEQYNQMFAAQSGTCAICSRHQSQFKTRLAVDHNHKTGEVRGLLCDPCNRAIGLLQESEQSLLKAVEYIKGVK